MTGEIKNKMETKSVLTFELIEYINAETDVYARYYYIPDEHIKHGEPYVVFEMQAVFNYPYDEQTTSFAVYDMDCQSYDDLLRELQGQAEWFTNGGYANCLDYVSDEENARQQKFGEEYGRIINNLIEKIRDYIESPED
jgi:hypothetical protein